MNVAVASPHMKLGSTEHKALIATIKESIEKFGEWVGQFPVGLCATNPKIQPRKGINTKERDELKQNIAEHGVTNGIMLRILSDDTVEVVSGNTRRDLCSELGRAYIPASVRIMNDEQARILAAAENRFRVPLSDIDEADYFALRLVELKGDTETLCREQGIKPGYLNARLPLTRAVPAVREAIANEQISLGHAQLCVTLDANVQAGFLAVIIDNGLSVAQAKERLDAKQRRLSAACFDTKDCQQCTSNTGFYKGLFQATTAAEDCCRNSKCFTEKTKARLTELRDEKQAEFGIAKLDIDVGNGTTALLTVEGSSGVGSDQIGLCASCEHYGCVISTIIPHEGKVTEGVCFNLACHAEKVKAHQSEIIATDSTTSDNGEEEVEKTGSDTESTQKPQAPQKPKTLDDLFLAKQIKKYAFATYGKIASATVTTSPHVVNVVSIFSLWREVKRFSSEAAFSAIGVEKDISIPDANVLSHLLQMTDNELGEVQNALTSALLTHIGYADNFEKDEFSQFAITVLKSMETNLENHWKVDEGYLKLLTKLGIETLLKDSGFKEKYIADKGEKAFTTLLANKMVDIPKLIIEYTAFDWTNFVPHGMNFNLYDISKRF